MRGFLAFCACSTVELPSLFSRVVVRSTLQGSFFWPGWHSHFVLSFALAAPGTASRATASRAASSGAVNLAGKASPLGRRGLQRKRYSRRTRAADAASAVGPRLGGSRPGVVMLRGGSCVARLRPRTERLDHGLHQPAEGVEARAEPTSTPSPSRDSVTVEVCAVPSGSVRRRFTCVGPAPAASK